MSKPTRARRQSPRKLPTRQAPPAILCIDDDRSALATRKSVLQGAGYRVFTANSGVVALEIAKTKHLDLALVDFEMAGMSGYAVAALLRATQPATRILLLSTFAPAPSQVNGELDGILIKGQPPSRLLEQIANHLTGTRSQLLCVGHARDSVA